MNQRAPKALGLEQLPCGEGCRSRAGSDGLRGTGAPCTPSGHSEGPETTDGNVNEGDSECISEKPFPPREGEAAAQVVLGAWSDLAPAPVAAGHSPRGRISQSFHLGALLFSGHSISSPLCL